MGGHQGRNLYSPDSHWHGNKHGVGDGENRNIDCV